MNAHDLLRPDAPLVADASAWWRVISLSDELAALVQDAVRDDRLWITPIVRMEVLMHRDAHFDRLAQALAFDSVMPPGP